MTPHHIVNIAKNAIALEWKMIYIHVTRVIKILDIVVVFCITNKVKNVTAKIVLILNVMVVKKRF